MKKPRILYYKLNSIMSVATERAFQRLGLQISTVACERTGNEWVYDEGLEKDLRKICDRQSFDIAFSLNFNAQVSRICEEKGIIYISWLNDSPFYMEDEAAVKRTCNRLFTFDRGYVEEYRKRGMPFFYMPLAVDPELFEEAIHLETEEHWRSEISMVANLYTTKYRMITEPLSDPVKELLEQMIRIQQKTENRSIFCEVLTEGFIEQMNAEYRTAGVDFSVDRAGLEYLLLSEVTGRERALLPSLLAREFEVRVYARDTLPLPGVKMEPPVDYYTQMPAVFRHSRINLNRTLRSIRTGIPLRVLDVLGCRGFLLTDAQEEILEYFCPDRDLAVYHSMEEAYEKARYYLSHDEERKKVAQAGYERVKKDFSFEQQIRKMLEEAVAV